MHRLLPGSGSRTNKRKDRSVVSVAAYEKKDERQASATLKQVVLQMGSFS